MASTKNVVSAQHYYFQPQHLCCRPSLVNTVPSA